MGRSFNIKKGYQVRVIAGKNKGKSGRVLQIITSSNRAIVERVNLVKRHTRPSKQNQKGGIVEKEAPIAISNLMVICGRCHKPTRVAHRVLEDGKKIRICKKCGEMMS